MAPLLLTRGLPQPVAGGVEPLIVDHDKPLHLSWGGLEGDVVVEIDGTPVTPKNIIELLVGNDVPGSSVTLKLARNSRSDQRTLQVVLKRAKTL